MSDNKLFEVIVSAYKIGLFVCKDFKVCIMLILSMAKTGCLDNSKKELSRPSLKITDNEDSLVKFELNLGEKSNFKPDSLNFNFKNKAYTVILNNVTPYPELNQQKVKEAEFIVKYKN